MIPAMNKSKESPRVRLIRESATLQLKLVADGLRDALLIPVSLVATVIGLLRGGDDCDCRKAENSHARKHTAGRHAAIPCSVRRYAAADAS